MKLPLRGLVVCVVFAFLTASSEQTLARLNTSANGLQERHLERLANASLKTSSFEIRLRH
jgi:hypothetical protein